MAIDVSSAIPIINNFGLQAKQLLDARSSVALKADLEELKSIATDGQLTYCAEDSTLYLLKDSIWTEVTDADALQTVQDEIDEINSTVGGMTGAFKFVGEFDTLPAADSYSAGNVVLIGTKEYVLVEVDGAKSWIEFGDEGSHVLKSRTIAINGVAKSLEADREFTVSATSSFSGSSGTTSSAGAAEITYLTASYDEATETLTLSSTVQSIPAHTHTITPSGSVTTTITAK